MEDQPRPRRRITRPIGKALIGSAVSARVAGGGSRQMALRAPRLVSPADGAVFDHFPRTTVLRWRRLPGAATYTVELDCFHCCEPNQWCTDVGRTWQIISGITNNSYTFDFVGAQKGAWRVSATTRRGIQGPMSPWREFTYIV
jgi:hypothetical protein